MNSYKNINIKVALVCDWLTELGGAEQVLLELTKVFPDAPIYTSQYRPKTAPWFNKSRVFVGWWLNILPRGFRKFISPLRAIYFSRLKLTDYDLVISVCNAECKAVKTSKSTLHVSYLQGPPIQYYWGLYDRYLDNPGFGKLNFLARLGLKLLVKPMRKFDYRASKNPDIIVANSNYVAQEVKKYYDRESRLIFPPVKIKDLQTTVKKVDVQDISRIKQDLFEGQEFFVIAGRQVNWKRFDLAVKSCLKTGDNLLVIGDGPEHKYLENIARGTENIKFKPRYDGPDEIAKYFLASKGFIFPSLEPFGIIPVEALSTGCPILAYKDGGSKDIVKNLSNGMFFNQQTVASLAQGIHEFNRLHFDRNKIAKSSIRFNQDNFTTAWLSLIENQINKKKKIGHDTKV